MILQELEQSHYTRADAANKKDPIKFYHKILRLTRYDNKSEAERAMTVYVHFESQLRLHLIAPSTFQQLINQLEAKKYAWFEAYQYFKKREKDSYETRNLQHPAPNLNANEQRGQYPRYPHSSTAPKQIIPPPLPPKQAYFINKEEYVYDAPSDSFIAPPNHPPGHTPHHQGNTHDDRGSEAMANWAAAEHRCSQHRCTHYH